MTSVSREIWDASDMRRGSFTHCGTRQCNWGSIWCTDAQRCAPLCGPLDLYISPPAVHLVL